MTLREFYKRARRVKWTVDVEGKIRTKRARTVIGKLFCPLGYVASKSGFAENHMPFPGAAAEALDMSYSEAAIIAARADGEQGWRGRYRLKRALGMCK